MKKYVSKLAEDFILVRIDFYNIENRIYLGEMTFYPYEGHMFITNKKYRDLFGNILNITQ